MTTAPLRITPEQFSDIVVGGIEADDGTLYAVYVPYSFAVGAKRFTVEDSTFVRSTLPPPRGQSAWKQQGVSEEGPFRAFAVEAPNAAR